MPTTTILTPNGYDLGTDPTWFCFPAVTAAKAKKAATTTDCIPHSLNADENSYIYSPKFEAATKPVSATLDLTNPGLSTGDYTIQIFIDGRIVSSANGKALKAGKRKKNALCSENLYLVVETTPGNAVFSAVGKHVGSGEDFATYASDVSESLSLTAAQIVGLHLKITGQGSGDAAGNVMHLNKAYVQLTAE